MNKTITSIIVAALAASFILFTSFLPNSKHTEICVSFYNVENLFDTINDPKTMDEEFTPGGKNHWTYEKYQLKLNHIARVIHELNESCGADVIGLSEIENKKVLEDLVNEPQIKNLNYQIAHHESPDERGIDVALIYKKGVMKVIGQNAYTVDISETEDRPTRDIVEVIGVSGKDTIHYFLNHWPSRRGGTDASEPKRMKAAIVLRHVIDSIWQQCPSSKFILMGDFNDNPTDKSVSEILKTEKYLPSKPENSLFNICYGFDLESGEGTEFYRGDWTAFIQIILSSNFIPHPEKVSTVSYHIFNPDWLLKEDEEYKQLVPFRTFNSDGEIGYSDHLPLYLELSF